MESLPKSLTLFFDGSCEPRNPGGWCTYGWLLLGDDGAQVGSGAGVSAGAGDPRSTNNFAEYCALGFGLKHLRMSGWRGRLVAKGDSFLVVNQIMGKWACNAEGLRPLVGRCRELLNEVSTNWRLSWVPREDNALADELARVAYEQATGRKYPVRARR